MNNTFLKTVLSDTLSNPKMNENVVMKCMAINGGVSLSNLARGDAYLTGKSVGEVLSLVHSNTAEGINFTLPKDGGVGCPLPFGMHGFHDRCHKAIFSGAVARRIGAVQTTYVWQYVIQYLFKLETLTKPCLIIGDINGDDVGVNGVAVDRFLFTEKSGIIGDSLMDFGAVFRSGLDENAEFVAGLESGYTLDLPTDWVTIAKMLDLGWWLIEIDRQIKGSPYIKPMVDGMLSAFTKLGAGNKNTFSYAVDTTALVQKRK